MMKVIVTLITYEDWVYSHPDPALVNNYMIPGGNSYNGERTTLTELAQKGLRADASPTEIDWLAVAAPPKPLQLINGKLPRLNGHPAYSPASVTLVVNQKVGTLLNKEGKVVGHSLVTPGKVAFSEILVQGPDGRWRIIGINKLDVASGLGSLKR